MGTVQDGPRERRGRALRSFSRRTGRADIDGRAGFIRTIGWLGSRDTDARHPELGRLSEFVGAINHEACGRVQGKELSPWLCEVFDGSQADSRDIASAIVSGAGSLAQRPVASFTDGADAFDHPIGAFNRFDRDDIPIPDSDGLADIEFEQFSEQWPDKLIVRFLL